MAHPYAGNPVYPASITIPDDGDLDAAAAYAIAFEQLADRCTALTGGGVGGSFTNATFHGTTTFADGAIVATVATASLTTTGAIALAAGAALTIGAGAALTLSAGGGISVASLIDFADQANFQGEAFFQTDAHLYGKLRHTTFGRELKRTATLPAATHTLTISEASIFSVPLLSANQSYPLSDADAEEGDTLRVNAWQNTASFDAQITYGARTWTLRNQSTYVPIIEFIFTGGAWIVNDGMPFGAPFNG